MNFLKVEKMHVLVILLICAFFSFCKSDKSKKALGVQNEQSCLTDSIVLLDTARECRLWLKQKERDFNLLVDGRLYAFDGSKLNPQDNPFGAGARDVYQITDEYEYDTRSKPVNLVRRTPQSIQLFPLSSLHYFMNDTEYMMQLHSYTTLMRLADNEFIAPALYIDQNDSDMTIKGMLRRRSFDKLGRFKVEQDHIVLEKVTNIYPRKDFLFNDTRAFWIAFAMCQSEKNFFVSPDFLDSIFCYDMNGQYEGSIVVPEELGFRYYDNSKVPEFNGGAYSASQVTGSKNLRLFYNPDQNHLLLVTLDGLKQPGDYTVVPSYEEMDWYVSVYDLNKKEWIKIIRFDKAHDKRNMMFKGRNILAKRQNSKRLIFDVYAY